MKPTFLAEWQTLPAKEQAQVLDKLNLLSQDPQPDGKTKKRLKGYTDAVCRLRSGDYRVFYVFQQPHVSVLALRRRDGAYDDEVAGENLGGLDGELKSAPTWTDKLEKPGTKVEKRKLPKPI